MRATTVGEVRGKRVSLALVEPDDAAFIHGLRVDPVLSRHLSPVSGGVLGQRAWLEGYKARERAGQEYYYLVRRVRDGRPCGTIRLYGIEENRLTWGSFMLNANKPPRAALETAYLSFSIAFDVLNVVRALVDVRRDNATAIAFYRRHTGASDDELFFEYTRAQFEADRDGHLRSISV
jgi:hypothetical protein